MCPEMKLVFDNEGSSINRCVAAHGERADLILSCVSFGADRARTTSVTVRSVPTFFTSLHWMEEMDKPGAVHFDSDEDCKALVNIINNNFP